MTTQKQRYQAAIDYLSDRYAEAKPELNYSSPFELLVAVVLSAQCTDKRVNMITPALFARYPDARAMAEAEVEDIHHLIQSVSYPNSKSTYLSELSRALVANHGGEVPHDLKALQSLKGVGRKTANVVSAVLWGDDVMPVDTHVFRVSERIGLTVGSTSPRETERQLTEGMPRGILADAHHWLLLHGRYVCTARKPKCHDCGLTSVCRWWLQR